MTDNLLCEFKNVKTITQDTYTSKKGFTKIFLVQTTFHIYRLNDDYFAEFNINYNKITNMASSISNFKNKNFNEIYTNPSYINDIDKQNYKMYNICIKNIHNNIKIFNEMIDTFKKNIIKFQIKIIHRNICKNIIELFNEPRNIVYSIVHLKLFDVSTYSTNNFADFMENTPQFQIKLAN